ncbi:MAG: pentapeptide repeat-containing protein [Candidatus Sumerlaeaceae bacterium]|nr:pentapeptide repeat-containing protein [Candidatus Sumerlaeaceae bacterium]
MTPSLVSRSNSSKALVERWIGHSRILSNSSPFGTSDGQLQDFRGFSFPHEKGNLKQSITAREFKFLDLSDADLSHIVVDECSFEDCRFARCSLLDTTFGTCRFFRCHFLHTDFRAVGLGVGTGPEIAEFDTCSFFRPKLSRAALSRVTFKNIEFDGKDWSYVNFGIADFWNCKLRGMFRACQFQDKLMRAVDRRFAGSSELGFHNVDMSSAEFFFVGIPTRLGVR